MKQTLHQTLWLVSLFAMVFAGCGNDVPAGPGRDCSSDGIGCSPGFSCVLGDDGRHTCIADEPDPDATTPMPDAAVPAPDAMVVTPDAMVVEPDAALPADGDGDGAGDGACLLR